MSLIKWTPMFDPFDEMDKAFNNLSLMPNGNDSFVPAVDMYEEQDSYIVETQLAGIDPANVEISIENDVLCLKGLSEKKSEIDEKNYYRKEIRRGSFFRSIPLPAHVLGDNASAETIDGVLKITIPKAPESKPKQIQIKVNK